MGLFLDMEPPTKITRDISLKGLQMIQNWKNKSKVAGRTFSFIYINEGRYKTLALKPNSGKKPDRFHRHKI
jgi:hypothetical protein